jgi:hypothetical protein
VLTSLAWLYDIAGHQKSQYTSHKNIAQKSAADFMQIDEGYGHKNPGQL